MRTEDIKRLYARRGVEIEPVSAPYPKDDAVVNPFQKSSIF